ncbi:nitrite reductase/ring-hydroxylating ferredoxin subunit [Spinactinospora alkalitolerans]|uniref:Nitrite reductase/ring-hydroxylating ferredoxin subunit n=1 Tax=Spinactinospora alkalitolerans TaxID=687207 RepID=A0A852TWC3_9ACTN|nr:Rieske 2Fe-2S domain-containing protein [Spinactinospora alkalitolerans]NYE47152.1 nitrite reductase/ring-hydroxylating ferredoxin subunit [Spinactinospora alkalitolerans]
MAAGQGTVSNEAAPRRSRGRAEEPSGPPVQQGADWSSWRTYQSAELGFRNYWYPTVWAHQVGSKPVPITLVGERIVLIREGDKVYGLHDRCPHRGVPLSHGRRQFPGTVSCPYHGWTFGLETGKLCAVITDGPESPICGKTGVATYPVEERLGLLFVYIGDLKPGETPPPVERDIPDELNNNAFVMGGRTDIRRGNWRFAAENGFDEGHAKYLHNTALWRLFKVMPTWNKTRIVEKDGWLIRKQDEVHWEADFPGVGKFTNKRWWKRTPLPDRPGKSDNINPVIADMDLPGFVSIRLPGLLRVAYPHFIHFEWYVPVDADHVRYVQLMVRFESGAKARLFQLKYLAAIRWLFHGQFTQQDAWMVDVMDAPPEKLYRPDLSITAWRKHIEDTAPVVQPTERRPGH